MWLTLDIGNSAAKGGLYAGARLERIFHVDLHRPALQEANVESAWARALHAEIQGIAIERVGMTSVVPSAVSPVTAALERLTDLPVERVQATMNLPFDLAYHTPETLGMDRLAAAAAAWTAYGRAVPSARHVVAIDAGTAVTLDVITRQGVYTGALSGRARRCCAARSTMARRSSPRCRSNGRRSPSVGPPAKPCRAAS